MSGYGTLAGLMGMFILLNIALIGVITSNAINKITNAIGKTYNKYMIVCLKTIIIVALSYIYFAFLNPIFIKYTGPTLGNLFSMDLLVWIFIGPICTAILSSIIYFMNKQ